MKIKLVFHTVGRVLLLEAALMLLPLAVSLIYGESCALAFAISAASSAAIGAALKRFCRSESKNLYTRDGLAIVALSWIGISLFGALPFVISGSIPSFIDAFFETVSGFTTTGASILTDVEALGTAGTGGFGIKADSIASYSHFCQWVITVFMLLFGVSFNMYYLLLIKRWREVLKSNELKCYLGISLAAMIIIALSIMPLYGSIADAVRLSAFQVSSIVTTTGYATADFDAWPSLAKAVLLILMFFGGCMGSTAGGLKMSRVTVLAQIARNDLRRALRPREVSSVILNGRRVDAQGERQILSYFALYIAVIGAVFLLISFEPFGIETNFSATVSCVNNIGPGFGQVGPSLSFADYSAFSKLVLSFAMLLGRLEIYPLLLLLSPQLWTKR